MPREPHVFLNGQLMQQGQDYSVVSQIHDEMTIEWKAPWAPLKQEDIVLVDYTITVEDDAVDKLADVVLPEEERQRRRTGRNLRRLFHAEAQLGISSRGLKKKW